MKSPDVISFAEHIDKTQKLVDDCVHYRNLAILLGAKPDQMVDSYDRELCRKGLDEGPDKHHFTMAEVLEGKLAEWDEHDALIEEIAQLKHDLLNKECVIGLLKRQKERLKGKVGELETELLTSELGAR